MSGDLDVLVSDLDKPDPRASGTQQFYFRKPEHGFGPKHFRSWYESLADYILANPTAKNTEIAAAFGKSPGWMSSIVNSDAFKSYFAQRRANYNELHDAALRDRATGVVVKALDVLLETMDKKKDKMTVSEIVKIQDSALTMLGYGQKGPVAAAPQPSAPPSVTVNVAVLREARGQIRQLEQERIQLVEAEKQTPHSPPLIEGSPQEDEA